jgi:hypothetical protein
LVSSSVPVDLLVPVLVPVSARVSVLVSVPGSQLEAVSDPDEQPVVPLARYRLVPPPAVVLHRLGAPQRAARIRVVYPLAAGQLAALRPAELALSRQVPPMLVLVLPALRKPTGPGSQLRPLPQAVPKVLVLEA